MTLLQSPVDEAAILASLAVQSTRDVLDSAVEEMVSQPRHVMIFQEGQEDLAHLAIQKVTKSVAIDVAPSNPSLDNIVVLDSTEDGWDEIVPVLDITSELELQPGTLHRSQSIIAFGATFLSHRVVIPLAHSATRFYAAVQDGPEVREMIERVHPMRQAVLL